MLYCPLKTRKHCRPVHMTQSYFCQSKIMLLRAQTSPCQSVNGDDRIITLGCRIKRSLKIKRKKNSLDFRHHHSGAKVMSLETLLKVSPQLNCRCTKTCLHGAQLSLLRLPLPLKMLPPPDISPLTSHASKRGESLHLLPTFSKELTGVPFLPGGIFKFMDRPPCPKNVFRFKHCLSLYHERISNTASR